MNQPIRDELEGLQLDRPDVELQASDELREWLLTEEGRAARLDTARRDRALRQELDNVPLPDGFRQRLADRIREASELPSADEERRVSVAGTREDARAEQRRASRSRASRWPVTIAISLAGLMLAGAVMAVVLWPSQVSISKESIVQRTLQIAAELPNQAWNDINSEILAQAPMPEDLAATPVRWSRMATDWDENTVVYDLSGPEQRTAMLFVVSFDRPNGLADRFPEDPDYFTGSTSVSSSYQNGRLYILMVEGDVKRYRSFLVPMWPFG